jgi:hypothetical protein
LDVFYAQYYIREAGTVPEGLDRVENGLVEASGSAARVVAGLHTGTIELAVELRSDSPSADLSIWDEAAEVSIDSPQGQLYVEPWGGGRAHLPNLASEGPGTYRLLVLARGRDTGATWSDERDGAGVPEAHMIIAWRAAYRPPVVRKATDRTGGLYRSPGEAEPATDAPGVTSSTPGPALISRPDLEVRLKAVEVDTACCTLHFFAEGRAAATEPARWNDVVACVMHGFVSPDGRDPGAALQVAVALPQADGIELTYRPRVQGLFVGGMALTETVEVDHKAKITPPPPRWPILVTVSWANVGLPPVTVTLDDPRHHTEP